MEFEGFKLLGPRFEDNYCMSLKVRPRLDNQITKFHSASDFCQNHIPPISFWSNPQFEG